MKTREQQIDIARRLISTGISKDLVEVLEQQFPELAEIEDERIRKWLYDVVANGEFLLERPFETKKILAYLEKQKINTEGDFARGYDCGYECCLNSHGAEWFEKQKEQPMELLKPDKNVEKTIEDVILFYGKTQGEWVGGYDIDTLIVNLRRAFNQKEQEPNIELIQRSWYMEGYHDRKFGKEPMWIIKTGEGGLKHEMNPKYGQLLADEQKPAEWSEEDEQWLESIIKDYEDSLTKDKDHAAVIKIKIDFLKSLRPQPKQEWSEEDERMRQTAIEACKTVAEDYENSNERFYKCKDWLEYRLKSLRPVKKEWSKKDEDKLYQVMETLLADKTVALRETPHCKALHEAYDEMLAWLKSLRPSWKPSEVQMEALRRTINKLAKSDVADSVRLSIMYDNLKKLM